MTEASSRDFKKKFNHCKLRVKEWEHNFLALYGRRPDKADIKADHKIKEYYNLYWKLKSTLLERQILGGPLDDSVIEPLSISTKENEDGCNQNKSTCVSSENSTVTKTKPSHTSAPSIKTNDPEDSSSIFKKSPIKEAASSKRKHSEPKKWMRNASSKLFEGVSFKLRNPRKALQKKSHEDHSSSQLNGGESSFMSEVSFQSCVSPQGNDSNTPELTFSVVNEVSPNIKSLIESSNSLSPLLGSTTKTKIVSDRKVPSHPLSILTQSARPKLVRKLDAGWVDRCTQKADTSEHEGRVSLDSGFESLTHSYSSPSVDQPLSDTLRTHVAESSDDDLICDSDDETSSLKILSLKRKADYLDSSIPVNDSSTNVTELSRGEVKKVKFEDSMTQSSINLPIAGQASSNKSGPAPRVNRTNELKKEILEKKMQAGTLNENYVKLNQKKKVFVRGKKSFNFSKHKKSQWKKKKQELNSGGEIGGVIRCFQCGDVGHYARYCQAAKEDKLLEVDDDLEQDCELPSLEEAETLARQAARSHPIRKNTLLRIPQPVDEESTVDLEGVPFPPRVTTVPPLEVSQADIECALHQFGHSSFRGGQEAAVKRILAGKSTLLMLSTGGGKSLCYQLPAFLYHKATPSIALVVSPLVSLMDDQVTGSLSFLKLGCLHSNQTEKQRANVIAQIEAGELSALLVSPEAVVSCDSFGFGSVLKKLPPIAFACIDEVHCVSQWSYNFRPSYLMLTKVLRERLNVKTFLGLTATASRLTVESIVKELDIEPEGVIQDTPLPAHLHLSVVRVEDKDAATIKLVQESNGGAILVYCTRRDECVRVATLIRTCLRGTTAEAYHAGLAASKRKSVQRAFMQGKLQVVVATVAFGMGINKQDIRRVLHYNMPKDWESYVQEVGRAGRDGDIAKCYLLLDPKGKDLVELRRHIYSNSVDRHVLRRLLSRVFVPCTCTPSTCTGHEVAFSAPETITALDIPEENICTLLCYLELNDDNLVQMMTPAYMTCRLSSYHGARGLRLAAMECPPLAVAAAQATQSGTLDSLCFDVIQLARQIGWESGTVKRHLKQAEWKKDKNQAWRRSGISTSFSDLGLRVRSKGDLTPEQLDKVLEYLVQRVEGIQQNSLSLLQSTFSTFHYFSTDLKEADTVSRSDEIKNVIRTYFKTETIPDDIPMIKIEEKDFEEETVAADVRHLVLTYRENTFNGRAAARIMHGIPSPNYPAPVWGRSRQWRAHLDKPFDRLLQIATREILRLK